MIVNRDKPDRWKSDISRSVDMYNDWFMHFAPEAYRTVRVQTTKDVEKALRATNNLANIGADLLKDKPAILSTLRMSTCPPLAIDRLIGLAGVPANLVKSMEKKHRMPPQMGSGDLVGGYDLDHGLAKISSVISRMIDPDIFIWLKRGDSPSERELYRASTIVADRLCGAVANPILRNAQEKRQLAAIGKWLTASGYENRTADRGVEFGKLLPGTYSFQFNMPIEQEGGGRPVNIPVDVAIMPKSAKDDELPLLIEAKSAGDFANVNKRRKEEAVKVSQLRQTYGQNVRFVLLLCGYFDSGYLGYEAAEGIDWVWEHRIEDLEKFGL